MPNILKRQAGFTLVESMVVLVVVGITLAASIPAFQRYQRSTNLRSGADQLAGTIRLCRQSAVAEGVNYGFIFSSQLYYYTFEDTNGDGSYSGGEQFWGPFYYPKGARVTSLSNGFTSVYLGFNPNGSTNQGGNINMVNDRGETMTLTLLSSTGQIFVERPDDAPST